MVLRNIRAVLSFAAKEDNMSYKKAKVYSDGSHYIAIPQKHTPRAPHVKVSAEDTDIEKNVERYVKELAKKHTDKEPMTDSGKATSESKLEEPTAPPPPPQDEKAEEFERLYKEHYASGNRQRRSAIIEEMKEFFDNTDKAETYVDNMLEKKKRNAVCRRVRLMKKVNLHKFNYFVTFTYDDKLHTEQSFKKKLTNTLSHLSSRKGWRYIGVWERSPETDRLHFHGIFKIPGEIPGELAEVKSFSTTDKRMQTALESSYFRKEFGRNDFKEFENGAGVADAVKYLLKYLEKTGEKLVYSRNLPQYFLSDIMDEDIVCRIGIEKRKLLLYDDFGCWDDGCYVGNVREDTIEKMPKAN